MANSGQAKLLLVPGSIYILPTLRVGSLAVETAKSGGISLQIWWEEQRLPDSVCSFASQCNIQTVFGDCSNLRGIVQVWIHCSKHVHSCPLKYVHKSGPI